MKLKLLTGMAGIDFSHNAGDIVEINDPDAIKRYIEQGIAEPVSKSKKETASAKNPAIKTAVED